MITAARKIETQEALAIQTRFCHAMRWNAFKILSIFKFQMMSPLEIKPKLKQNEKKIEQI